MVTEEVSPATLWARQWWPRRRRGLRGCRRRRCCLRTRHQAQRRLWTVSLALWLRSSLAFSWCCVVFHSGIGLGVWFGSGPSIGLGVGLGSGVSIGVFGSGVGLLARRSLRRCLRRCFQLQARLSDPSLGDSAPSLGHSASILALERPACFRASERYLPLVYSLFRYSGAAMSS